MSTAIRRTVASGVIASGLALLLGVVAPPRVAAQAGKAPQKIDAEYTAKIKEVLQDARITTELVDHLPASDTVPTPLKFLDAELPVPTKAPTVGEHTDQVLGEVLGYDDAKVAALREAGALG